MVEPHYIVEQIIIMACLSGSMKNGRVAPCGSMESEWPSGLYSFRQVTEVKLGRIGSNSGWVTLEA